MRNLQAEPPIANTGDDADVMAAARARLTQAADALMAADAARRLVDDIAEAMREDVLAAEQALQVFASLFARAIERLDDHGECLEVDGRTCRRARVHRCSRPRPSLA